VIIAGLCAVGGCGKHTISSYDPPSDWKRFQHLERSVELAYPPDMQLQSGSHFRTGEKWEQDPDWELIVSLDNGGVEWAGDLVRPGAVAITVFRQQLEAYHEQDYFAAQSLAWRWPHRPEDGQPTAVRAHGIDMAELSRDTRFHSLDLRVRVLIRADTKAKVAYALLATSWPGGGERQGELMGEVAESILASVRE
jgi:hypothetical protein